MIGVKKLLRSSLPKALRTGIAESSLREIKGLTEGDRTAVPIDCRQNVVVREGRNLSIFLEIFARSQADHGSNTIDTSIGPVNEIQQNKCHC